MRQSPRIDALAFGPPTALQPGMRINFVLAASLSLLAACTDEMSTPDAGTATANGSAIVTAVRPSKLQMTQPAAAALCTPLEHLPTSLELQDELGDCVRTSIGLLCRPLSVAAGAAPIGDLELAQVWTSTSCEHGFVVGNFDTGEISCQPTTSTEARPLCLH